ncbi:MAG: hypothetical protein ACM31L_09505 [Actinomycetota bacterium]
MDINRRGMLALGLGMVLRLPAAAEPVTQGNGVLDALAQTPWIADGKPSRRHVYVVFAPWCPVCKLLFQRTRGARDGVQLRWVAGGSRDDRSINQNLNAVSARSLDMLTRIFLQPGAEFEDLQKNTQAVFSLIRSEGTIKTIAPLVNLTGYPTLIFPDRGGGIQAISGLPRDLDALFALVGSA